MLPKLFKSTYRIVNEVNDMYPIKVANVIRKFGNFTAVSNMNFSIEQGEIIGLLGRNGAGKTTIIKMLTGQLFPTSGTIEVFGKDIMDTDFTYMNRIGYVPDTPILYEGLTAREMLTFIGKLYKLEKTELDQRIDALISTLNLNEFEHERIETFSLGMKKKVSIAAGMIHSPQLLILDEVTNGLDPKVSREVKNLIKRLNKEKGVTVLITTHILDVVEEMADRLIIIDKGKLIDSGPLETLKDKYGIHKGKLEDVFLSAIDKERSEEIG